MGVQTNPDKEHAGAGIFGGRQGIDVNTLYTEQRNGSGPENQDLWVC